MTFKGLLIEDRLLVVNPSLAKKIGLNEAIVLQQVLYWIKNPKAGVFIGGYKWVYNSIPQWAEQFPFWSEATIKRTLSSLRDKKCLVAEQLSSDARDKTLYYRLSDKIISDLCIGSICTDAKGQYDQIPIYTKTTTNTNDEISQKQLSNSSHEATFEDFWKQYPRKISKANARKSWLRIKPDADLLKTILDAVSKQKRSDQWVKDNGKFIPHAATWLNNERWLDELEQPSFAGDSYSDDDYMIGI